MNSNYEFRKYIGFQYILELMTPNTPFGNDEVKRIKPYVRSEKEKLLLELNEIERIVQTYEVNEKELKRLEHAMMNLKDIRGALKKAEDICLNDVELFEIKQFLLCFEELKAAFTDWNMAAGLTSVTFGDTAEALSILDPHGNKSPGFYIYEAYSEKLDKIRLKKKQVELVLRQTYIQEERDKILEDRKKLICQEEEEEGRIRGLLTEKLKSHTSQILNNIKETGKLDYYIQKAKIAVKYQGVKPCITDTVYLQAAMNPEISEILKEKGKIFKTISITLHKGVTIITGANMGGKTVSLKTIALNIYLAQCGFFVYAGEAQIPIFDYLHIIANDYQSLKDGLSSFGGEITELNTAMEKVDKGFGFFMFDEFARGTNPDEGTEILQAVVKYLNQQNAITLITTHFDHVAQYADAHYQVVGLKDRDIKELSKEIEPGNDCKNVEVIAKYMDYGIFPVAEDKECPKDAVTICRLLGLDEKIMKIMEQNKK